MKLLLVAAPPFPRAITGDNPRKPPSLELCLHYWPAEGKQGQQC